MEANLLTKSQVSDALDYSDATGEFVWKKRKTTGPALEGRRAGYLLPAGYRVIRLYGKKYYAHRLAWLLHSGDWPKGDVDHINGVPSDNRICNLRDVSHSENLQNQLRSPTSNKTSGLLGVSLSGKEKRWIAQIKINGKSIRLGSFLCKFEAHDAYVKAKRNLHPASTI